MSPSNQFTKSRLSRRALLGAATAGLGAAALGGVTACSSGSGNTSAGSGPKIDPSKKVNLPAPSKDVLYPDPYVGPKAYDRKPFADGSKTFKVVVPQDATTTGDWNKNTFSSWLEKRTGVKIEYEAVNLTGPDGSQDLSKINAMLSSGDLPDAFLSVGLTPSQVSLYGEQGLFQDLTALIDTYAPMAREMMSSFDTIKPQILAKDGKIYQYVGVNDCYHCRSALSKAFINQDYLDKIGAQMPETIDDFRNVLKEFKARNPSGKKGFLPFLGGNPTWDGMDVWFVNPFTYNPGSPWFRLNGDKVEFVAALDEWRQGMAYMRSLYDDGTLTKQSFSIEVDDMVKLGDQGLIGCCRAFNYAVWLSVDPTDKNSLYWQYEPVMPLKGPSGKGITSTNYYIYLADALVVTNKCKNPELLVQWADYQMDLEAIMRGYASGGDKGKQWDWATKGQKGIDGRQAVWETVSGNANPDNGKTIVGRGWNQYSLMYRSLDFRNGQYNDPKTGDTEGRLYQVSKRYEQYDQPKDEQLPPLLFDDSDTATIGNLATTIGNQVTQSMAKFATAQLDINNDAVWKNYLNTLNKMGLKQYTEIYQKAYDNRPQ